MKDFYEITMLSPFRWTVGQTFETEKDVKDYIAEAETGPQGIGLGTISYIVTKKVNYVVETHRWVSHDNLIPGLKAGVWYGISYAEDDPSGDPIYLEDDDCG